MTGPPPASGAVRVRRHPDGAAFLRRAGDWLLRAEAENNLVLGIARRLLDPAPAGAEPPYLATVEDDGGVAGCAFRTPPFGLGLTRLPPPGPAALARDLAGVYKELPGVLGPEPEARAFAAAWGRLRSVAVRPGMRQRIHELVELVPPARPAPGRLRDARPADLPLAAAWLAAFAAETGLHHPDPAGRTRELARDGDLVLWEDGEPRCLAAVVARTPNGARIGYVYTPPDHRGRGYATACVGGLTRRVLEAGARFCCLYTDVENPTSNAIYRRLGYRPVADVAEYRFGPPEEGGDEGGEIGGRAPGAP